MQYSDLQNVQYKNFFQFPIGVAKQTSRGITQTLDQIGGRILGLQ